MLKKNIQGILQKMGYQLVHYKKNVHNQSKLSFIPAHINIDKFDFLVRGRDLIKQLISEYQASLSENKSGELVITIHGLSFIVNTWEELLILHEVYCTGMYNYVTAHDYLLIDVGMNVGITSLFHSHQNNCKKIFSFEPFEETIALAKKNFQLNQSSAKINVHQFGLGFPERNLEINYSPEYKGSVGINGVASYVHDEHNHHNRAILTIKDVATTLKPIIDENPNLKVVMKIDAEGVEYEILERLAHQNILQHISALMIEWHLKGPSVLEEILAKHHFKMLSFSTKNKQIGMLYAFNERC